MTMVLAPGPPIFYRGMALSIQNRRALYPCGQSYNVDNVVDKLRTTQHSHNPLSSLLFAGLLKDRLHHFVAQPGCFGELRCEVLLDPFKAVAVGLEVAERHAIRPCL